MSDANEAANLDREEYNRCLALNEEVSTLRARIQNLEAALRRIVAVSELTFLDEKGAERAMLKTARAALEEE